MNTPLLIASTSTLGLQIGMGIYYSYFYNRTRSNFSNFAEIMDNQRFQAIAQNCSEKLSSLYYHIVTPSVFSAMASIAVLTTSVLANSLAENITWVAFALNAASFGIANSVALMEVYSTHKFVNQTKPSQYESPSSKGMV